MSEHKALLDAIRHTDISFFGPIFDRNRAKLIDDPNLSGETTIASINQRALALTLSNSIIARVAVERIIEALDNGTCGTQYFSPVSRQVLESLRAPKP